MIRNDARQRLHCNESQGSVDVTTFLYFGVACDDRHRPVRPHLDYGRTRGLVHRRCNVRSRPVSYRQRSGTHECPSIDICFDTDSSHVYHDHATARFSPNRAVCYSHRGELHADAGYGIPMFSIPYPSGVLLRTTQVRLMLLIAPMIYPSIKW